MDINIGLLGCGTVGEGVVELVRRRTEKITDLTGFRPLIRKILVRDVTKTRNVAFVDEMLTANPTDILQDASIQVVVETIGGIEPARSFILQALRNGKHVITANKDLIALHGTEILEVAETHGVDVLFEAAVGGAIPLVGPLKDNLTANEVTDLKGIINGTTNYILTKMTETGTDFYSALAEAQRLGFAEADPSSDVDGLDAARKLVILASIAFQTTVHLDEVQVTGIRHITASDVAYAAEIGTVIKLLAVGSDNDGQLALSVRPTLIPKAHPLAHVSGSFNALFVRGDAAGDLMFFGRGAGSLPTASAVVGDVIALCRNLRLGVAGQSTARTVLQKSVQAADSTIYRHYLRMSAHDRPGVFARIAQLFGEADASMETVLQKRAHDGFAEIVVVIHESSVHQVSRLVQNLEALPDVAAVNVVMPVEPLAE